MSNEKIIKATEFLDKAMNLTDKQFEKFCDKMQKEFKDASTEKYTTILHIICSLDVLRKQG
ncbi:MAG: hypothetical protein K2J59_08300 [Eubacterium sp.]|nr:hypothetical protein [Eubacterium sp.]MDE6752753.1 hypothetical protein [Eubacterium sp.]